jgi:soluble lytic murein transglycosylase-like protein
MEGLRRRSGVRSPGGSERRDFLADPRDAMEVGSHQLRQVRRRGALGVLVPALALFAAGRAWLGDHTGA